MIAAIDGMGGDYSPSEVVKGCVEASNEYDVNIIITGFEDSINSELNRYKYDKKKIKVINTSQVISNNDQPVLAITKQKKDSSLYKILELVKSGEADAAISAGSTGAFMVGARLIIGKINGIEKPALAPIMPGKNAPFMVIDCGANADCKPIHLVKFALMAKIYFENILNIKNPSIGLINIGSEEEKGNKLTKSTYKLLKECNFNFKGNIEPRDITNGDVNILVCDGFTGNTVLKMYEGVSSNIFKMLKGDIMSSFTTKIGGMLLKPVFSNFKKKFDYREYGGSAFLGVNGICIKAHGSSDAKAFKNAIKQSIVFHDNKIIDKIKINAEKINSCINI